MHRLLILAFAVVAAAENWPNFRGPSRQGVATGVDVPLRWTSGENLLWQTEVPGAGWSSPIVWGNRIFLTTATEAGRSCRVLAVDRRNGRVLWNTEVLQQTPTRKEKKNSYATPTPATDGKLVYSVFGDGSIAAVNYSGRVVWTNREHRHYSQHGLGASPVLWRDLLIMPYDGSAEEGDLKVGWQKPWDRSFIVALDKSTGKVRWKGRRGLSRIAHVTPNIVEHAGKPQLVSAAGDVVQGFDLADGELLWSARSQGEGVVPSVVVGDSMVFTSSGFEKPAVRGIRIGGEIAWEQTRGVPKIPSFVYSKGLLFTIAENGIAMCMKADSGEIVWQERVGGEYSASPVLVGERIYLLSEAGETTVLRAGPSFEVIAKSVLEGRFQASPAVADKAIYLRSDTRLYAIGRK
jgi:outer membrane protein assembly factor BamB